MGQSANQQNAFALFFKNEVGKAPVASMEWAYTGYKCEKRLNVVRAAEAGVALTFKSSEEALTYLTQKLTKRGERDMWCPFAEPWPSDFDIRPV